MKKLLALFSLSTLLLSASTCGEKKGPSPDNKLKGRLEVQGICMNYTISLLDGKMDTSMLVAYWTDEVTRKPYKNVFRLSNPCDFPSSLKQGDEFYFTIDTAKDNPCVVCMAYYPTPYKAVKIKVLQ